MSDWIIGIGGTGSRCAESAAHLAAMGLFPEKPRFILLDLDQTNGNLQRSERLIAGYNGLAGRVGPSSMFGQGMEGHVWNLPQGVSMEGLSFGALVGRKTAGERAASFLDLFFPTEHYDLDLRGGCYQKPEIGAIALRQLIRRGLEQPNDVLRTAAADMARELNADNQVRIFVLGSVFGGTGASGIPFVPELFRHELAQHFGAFAERGHLLRLGGALIGPYFQWRGAPGRTNGGPDPRRLGPHAKTILHHYSEHPPEYDRMYLLGAPDLFTSGTYAPQGEQQLHQAHYIEMVAGLAALDFFTGDADEPVSYAESTVGGDAQHRLQRGVNWTTLPFGLDAQRAQDIRRGMVASAVLDALVLGYLLPGLDSGFFDGYPWFEDLVGEALTAADGQQLAGLCTERRRWLAEVSATITEAGCGADHPSLLPLEMSHLGILGDLPTGRIEDALALMIGGDSPSDDFHWLCTAMDAVERSGIAGRDHEHDAVGRLLFVVETAIDNFLEDAWYRVEAVSPGVPASEGYETQSRFLPKVAWEPRVEARMGAFTHGSAGLLRALADGLVIGDADLAATNPISSPWAQTFLFETALSGNGAHGRAATDAWRGLLGIVALRKAIGDGTAVTARSLPLHDRAGWAGAEGALEEFYREARSRQGAWLEPHLILVGSEVVGATSPLTFVFPSIRMSDALRRAKLVPWFDPATGQLGDPAVYLSRHPDTRRYLPALAGWIDRVLSTSLPGLEQALAGSASMQRFQAALSLWRQSAPFANVTPHAEMLSHEPWLGSFSLPTIEAHDRGLKGNVR